MVAKLPNLYFHSICWSPDLTLSTQIDSAVLSKRRGSFPFPCHSSLWSLPWRKTLRMCLQEWNYLWPYPGINIWNMIGVNKKLFNSAMLFKFCCYWKIMFWRSGNTCRIKFKNWRAKNMTWSKFQVSRANELPTKFHTMSKLTEIIQSVIIFTTNLILKLDKRFSGFSQCVWKMFFRN